MHLADVVEVFQHTGGVEAAVGVARARSGGQLDPALVTLFTAEAEAIFGELDQVATWDAVMSKAPTASRELSQDELDQALAASEDFVDLKSPYTLGHSRLPRPASWVPTPGLYAWPACRTILVGWVSPIRSGTSAPLTAGEVERVRLSNRAMASMFASRHTLV